MRTVEKRRPSGVDFPEGFTGGSCEVDQKRVHVLRDDQPPERWWNAIRENDDDDVLRLGVQL